MTRVGPLDACVEGEDERTELAVTWSNGQLLTEDDGGDADPRQAEPSQKAQHRELDVGGGEGAGDAEHHRQDVGNQEAPLPAVPEHREDERRRSRERDSFVFVHLLIAEESEGDGAGHHPHEEDGAGGLRQAFPVADKVPLQEEVTVNPQSNCVCMRRPCVTSTSVATVEMKVELSNTKPP